MKIQGFDPLPKKILGWNGDSLIFKELIDQVKPKTIIEVGSWYGMSTITMAKACSPETKIYCVDTWLGSYEFIAMEDDERWNRMLKHGYPQAYYQFLSNIIHEGVVDKIEVIPTTSENAVPHLPQADLIYIDGQHTYKGVKEDLENYYPKLNKGGVIFGDDYFIKEIGDIPINVGGAVDDFAKKNNLKVDIYYKNFWAIKK